jgi:hypothetical protein
MNRVKPRVFSNEELAAVKEAERHKAQGQQNFEAIYGSKAPVSLVVSNEEIRNSLQALSPENLLALKKYASKEEIEALKKAQDTISTNPTVKKTDVYVPSKNQGVAPMTTTENPVLPEIKEEEKKDTIDRLVDQMLLDGLKTPSVEYLRQCKAIHGDLFVLPLYSKVYIYRYLKRQEWSQLNIDPTFNKLTEIQQNELLFDKCLIWPQLNPIEKAASPAGLTETIVEQIKLQSCFINPNAVAEMTFKL